MDRFERFDLDRIPVDNAELRELFGELNVSYAQFREVSELQETDPQLDEMNLYPVLNRIMDRQRVVHATIKSIIKEQFD